MSGYRWVYAQVAGHEAIVAMVKPGAGIGIAPELVVGQRPARQCQPGEGSRWSASAVDRLV